MPVGTYPAPWWTWLGILLPVHIVLVYLGLVLWLGTPHAPVLPVIFEAFEEGLHTMVISMRGRSLSYLRNSTNELI